MQMHRRSKALASGVEVGDILIAINGQHCRYWTTDQAMDTINNSTSPGNDDVTLHLLRYHRLNGSSSHVLTATSLSYGKPKNSTPTESKPLI